MSQCSGRLSDLHDVSKLWFSSSVFACAVGSTEPVLRDVAAGGVPLARLSAVAVAVADASFLSNPST